MQQNGVKNVKNVKTVKLLKRMLKIIQGQIVEILKLIL